MGEQHIGYLKFKNKVKGRKMNLTDTVIAHIAKLVQIAMLTGTDVVDNLRTIRLIVDETNSSQLELDPDYETKYNDNLEKMMNREDNEEV